jgi:hypothetical protein
VVVRCVVLEDTDGRFRRVADIVELDATGVAVVVDDIAGVDDGCGLLDFLAAIVERAACANKAGAAAPLRL